MSVRKHVFAGAAAVGLMVATGTAAHADLYIDDFETGDFTSTNSTSSPPSIDPTSQDGLATGNTIGGSRDSSSYIQTLYSDPGTSSAITTEVEAGEWSFSQDTGNFGHGWIQWDGEGDDAWDDADEVVGGTGFGPGDNNDAYFSDLQNGLDDGVGPAGYDITGGGAYTQFALDVASGDLPDIQVLFRFYDADNFSADRYAAITFEFDGPLGNTTFMSAFSSATFFGGADASIFGQVGAIVMHTHSLDQSFDRNGDGVINGADSHADLDLAIEGIRATGVPAPGALAMMGTALLGIGGVAYRRRRQSA